MKMDILNINNLLGLGVRVESMLLDEVHNQVNLSMKMVSGGERYVLYCENVSSLSLISVSYPVQISGIAITGHSTDGWQADMKYEVYDFEDGVLRFFCQEIKLDKG